MSYWWSSAVYIDPIFIPNRYMYTYYKDRKPKWNNIISTHYHICIFNYIFESLSLQKVVRTTFCYGKSISLFAVYCTQIYTNTFGLKLTLFNLVSQSPTLGFRRFLNWGKKVRLKTTKLVSLNLESFLCVETFYKSSF